MGKLKELAKVATNATNALREIYFPENAYPEEVFDEKNPDRSFYLLEAVVESVLSKSELNPTPETVKDVILNNCHDQVEFMELLKEVNLERAIKGAEVRKDWDAALSNVENGRQLSGVIDFGFHDNDLVALAKLHQANKHRQKIEDLLEDCNFHRENGYLQSGEYDAIIEGVPRF